MPPPTTDAIVIGAGIVGLATARALVEARPGTSVLVLDKERRVAAHQTGHNSGVVHSGVYYAPGSLKARLVGEGRRALLALCRERGLRLEVCGKVIVATDDREASGLRHLATRAEGADVEAVPIGPGRLAELEPHVAGVAALHVPSAAIVDFAEVARALADDLGDSAEVRLGRPVEEIADDGARVVVETGAEVVRGRVVVNCAGLHADVVARRSGLEPEVRILPFRGEYHQLVPSRRHLVRNLVYPVPDPRFPFLGVHLTRMVDGTVHAGPNAVLALSREGYSWRATNARDLREMATSPALRHLARRHWRTGAMEVRRSLSTRATARALRRLVPDLRAEDLVPAGAGVRAQAVRPDGTLVDDFVIERAGRVVHVLNAPSPAATASLAIGRHIAASVAPLLDRAP